MSTKSARLRLQEQRLKHARVTNARNERFSGAGTQYDYGTANMPGPNLWMSPTAQDQIALNLYRQDWAARKICSIPVDDMLRDGWEIKGPTDEQVDLLEDVQDQLGALTAFRQAMRLERLLGGAAIYMGVSDGQADPAVPLNYAGLQPGSLKFLNVVPRSRVSRTDFEMNPMCPGYGRPSHFWIQGQRVHTSRLILFKGDPLLDVPDSTIAWTGVQRNDGFGDSKLLSIMDDLTRATGSRQAAFQLVQRAGVFFAQTDDGDLGLGPDGQADTLDALRDIVNQINTFRGAVFKTSVGQAFPPISTISPAFGSVPELVMSFLQVLSAASDIPATRFLGQAPGGLNATGESDLENYYGRLESEQRQSLRPQLYQLLQVMIPSTLGTGYNAREIDVDFEPLWSMSEKEEAEVRKIEVDTVVAAVGAGIVTTEEAAAELNAREVFEVQLRGEVIEPPPTEPDAPALADSLAALTATEPVNAGDPA